MVPVNFDFFILKIPLPTPIVHHHGVIIALLEPSEQSGLIFLKTLVKSIEGTCFVTEVHVGQKESYNTGNAK